MNLSNFFTPEERLKIYQLSLKFLSDFRRGGYFAFGVCGSLARSCEILFREKYDYISLKSTVAKNLPEFASQSSLLYWFPRDKEGAKMRIKVLRNCISEVKKIIQNEQENKNK